MAMAGGDTVMVQPTPLEPMPAMPMAARTMALIPIATATTPTVATDAFWFATNNHELRTLALRQRVQLVGTTTSGERGT